MKYRQVFVYLCVCVCVFVLRFKNAIYTYECARNINSGAVCVNARHALQVHSAVYAMCVGLE